MQELEQARDLMWKFKLQKNNKELLCRLQNAEARLLELRAEETLKFQQAHERVVALESKVAALQTRNEEEIEARRVWLEELRETKEMVARALDISAKQVQEVQQALNKELTIGLCVPAVIVCDEC